MEYRIRLRASKHMSSGCDYALGELFGEMMGMGEHEDSKKWPWMTGMDEAARKDLSVKITERGIEFRNEGCLEVALDDLDEALALDPTNMDAWNNRGCVLGEMALCEINEGLPGEKRLEESLACFGHALEIDPGDWATWTNEGNTLLMLGKVDEALACHDRATELSPDSAPAWFNKGLALARAEYYAEALQCFEKALEINPEYKEAWVEKYKIHRRWDELWDMTDCHIKIEMIEEEEREEREGRAQGG